MEVVSNEVSIRTGTEKMPAHLARPASGGPYPALVVVMEAFGLNDQIRRITNQFAAEGFIALAPNLYFRQPNNVVAYNDLPGAFRLMGSGQHSKTKYTNERAGARRPPTCQAAKG